MDGDGPEIRQWVGQMEVYPGHDVISYPRYWLGQVSIFGNVIFTPDCACAFVYSGAFLRGMVVDDLQTI